MTARVGRRIAGLLREPPRLGPAPDARRAGLATGRVRASDARRIVRRYHRPIRAAALAVAIACALATLAQKPPHTVAVIAAARDLASGAVLAPGDVRVVNLPAAAVPSGAVMTAVAVVGARLAGAVRRGEPLTDARLVAGPLVPPGKGKVSMPIRFGDAEAAALLQVGQHIDVLAAATAVSTDGPVATSAAIVASDVAVVALPTIGQTSSNSGGGVNDPALDGALVVVACTPAQARALAQAEVSARLSAMVIGI